MHSEVRRQTHLLQIRARDRKNKINTEERTLFYLCKAIFIITTYHSHEAFLLIMLRRMLVYANIFLKR